jgi:hypothetical protein
MTQTTTAGTTGSRPHERASAIHPVRVMSSDGGCGLMDR